MELNESTVKKIFNKVPQITVFFWIIKILCTTVGETFADFINFNLGLGLTLTTLIMGVALCVVLFFQLKAKQYHSAIYWLTVVLLSVFGTLVTDNLTDNMAVPLEVSTVVFSILLALTFLGWYLSEKTLSIHSIYTFKREVFYWLTILFTFALGTAVGDLYSEQLGFGYLNTGIGVITIIALVYLAYKRFNLNSILAFWIAYILTRPLGASLGDLLSQPKANGGLGLGTTVTSIIFLIAILAIIIFLAVSKIDKTKETDTAETVIKPMDNRQTLMQTIAVLVLFLVVGVGGYQWRMHSIAPTTASLSGQMDQFIKDENQISRNAAQKNWSETKKSADQLEHDWDADEPKLRAMDSKGWTKVDVTIDGVLSSVRTSNPDINKIKNAVTASEQVINKLNK